MLRQRCLVLRKSNINLIKLISDHPIISAIIILYTLYFCGNVIDNIRRVVIAFIDRNKPYSEEDIND